MRSNIQNEIKKLKILIAYFSWSGNTKTVAEYIHEATSGELFEIKTFYPYEYNLTVDIAKEEQRTLVLIALKRSKAISIGAAALLPHAFLFSHGVEVSEVKSSAKVVRFSYTDNEPMMYAKVKLYSPSSPKVETLKSLTDMNGFFAFVPNEDGKWRVEAQDGMGHRGEITVDTLKTSLDADDKNTSVSTAFRIVLGLSLILINVCLNASRE
ncbi:MAG: hypothetical protein LBF86_04525 [Helicobacteraceae bacterium]|jgi:nickel transport protein|nr:hypothetical protein [Helicobacteraceae bacterium]